MDISGLSIHPRPSLKRDSFYSLNGTWNYEILDNINKRINKDDTLVVPFSPECQNDKHILKPDETLIYKKSFKVKKEELGKVLLLHFIAIDQIAEFYFNDELVSTHIGGFLPIDLEIRNYKEENNLKIVVKDLTDSSYHSRGKQKLKSGGIFYTPQSGIYMPVYYEIVNDNYIKDIKFTPDVDSSSLKIYVKTDRETIAKISFGKMSFDITTNKENIIKIPNVKLWSIDNPFLYECEIKTDSDLVSSYFAFRKISVVKDSLGHKRIALNDKPLYLSGVLDQGYYKDGLLTPNSFDEYHNDIHLLKDLGFNFLRKHIKIEPDIFYYYCDKLGMLVMQDFVNGGGKYKFFTISVPLVSHKHLNDHLYKKFARSDKEGRDEFINEAKETVSLLYNHPSIFSWTIFNEGWGQFDSKEVYHEVTKLDSTRLIDHASGWHDQGISDFKSDHVYFRKYKLPKEKTIKDRIVFLSEFGGYSCKFGDSSFRKFGYKMFKDKDALTSGIVSLFDNELKPAIKGGLSISVYTQLSDVEGEINGFTTFDHRQIKVDVERIKQANLRLYEEFNSLIFTNK